jgi:hypothetical protein
MNLQSIRFGGLFGERVSRPPAAAYDGTLRPLRLTPPIHRGAASAAGVAAARAGVVGAANHRWAAVAILLIAAAYGRGLDGGVDIRGALSAGRAGGVGLKSKRPDDGATRDGRACRYPVAHQTHLACCAPRERVAALTGDEWLAFLKRTQDDSMNAAARF